MNRKIRFSVGEMYHIYNRGNDKKVIFKNRHDYKRFMLLMYLCNNIVAVDIRALFNKGLTFVELFEIDKKDELVDIGAFCLMPNHFHILLCEKVDGGISLFMQKMSTAYSMYFNAKNNRRGSLFEGTFKSKHIDTDEYLNWIFSYIHLNPIKLIAPNWKDNGISNFVLTKDFMKNYMYSSYYDYFLGDRLEKSIINKNVFPDHLLQLNDLEEIIEEFNNFNKGLTFVENNK
jgi:putative transposase